MKRKPFLQIILVGFCGLTMAAQAEPVGLDFRSFSSPCKVQVLRRLGWQVEDSGAASASVLRPNPNACRALEPGSNAPELAELSLSSSEDATPLLDQALRSEASLCAYKEEYSQALHKAVNGLSLNHLYLFNSGIGSGEARMRLLPNWSSHLCGDGSRCYTPAPHRMHEAIADLYRSLFTTECATGLQLAEYATIDTLFGSAGVEQMFRPDEFLVADWDAIEPSSSVIHGTEGRRIEDPFAMGFHANGAKKLIGAPGYLGAVDEDSIDDKDNINENFIVTDTTNAAMDALKSRAFLMGYQGYLNRVFGLSSQLNWRELESLQRLEEQGHLARADAEEIQSLYRYKRAGDVHQGFVTLSNERLELLVRLAQMLSDPFLEQTRIYVHPVGVRSFSWHILRLARLNPRTPYLIRLYRDSANAEIFDRWLKYQLQQCENIGVNR